MGTSRIDRLSRRTALRRAVGGGFVAVAAGAPQRVSAKAAATTSSPVVERWAEAWNAHSPEQMAALFTDDGVYEDLAFGFALEGKEGVASWVSITIAGAPDTHVDVVYSFQVEDRAAAHWIFSGTHTGAWGPDLPPTGQPFSLPVGSLFELDGDLIRRVGDYYNLATWLRQVGLPYGPYTPPETVPDSTVPESTLPS